MGDGEQRARGSFALNELRAFFWSAEKRSGIRILVLAGGAVAVGSPVVEVQTTIIAVGLKHSTIAGSRSKNNCAVLGLSSCAARKFQMSAIRLGNFVSRRRATKAVAGLGARTFLVGLGTILAGPRSRKKKKGRLGRTPRGRT